MGDGGAEKRLFWGFFDGAEGQGTSALPGTSGRESHREGNQGWGAGDRGARVQRDEDGGPVRYGAEQRMFFAIPGNVRIRTRGAITD